MMTVDTWLKGQDFEMKKICELLRHTTLQVMPSVKEFVYHNAIGFSLTTSPFDRVSYIAVQNSKYVNYGFFLGKDLPDPTGLIQGTGKRIRHVKIFTLEAAGNPEVRKLMEAAWHNAEEDMKGWRQSLKRKKGTVSK